MSINNEELRHLRTIGDVKQFIECKVRGLPLPKPTKFLPIEQIAGIMPIQPPFLFLNEAQSVSHGASAKYKISGQEFFLQGHFKDNPVLPASIMIGGYWPAGSAFSPGRRRQRARKDGEPKKRFSSPPAKACAATASADRATSSVFGEAKRLKLPLATFEGAIRVGQEKAAIAEEITLTFDLADALAVEPAKPAAANGEEPLAGTAISA